MYGPRFFVGYTFLAACKKKKKNRKKERQIDDWTDKSIHFTELPHYTQIHKTGRDNHC